VLIHHDEKASQNNEVPVNEVPVNEDGDNGSSEIVVISQDDQNKG